MSQKATPHEEDNTASARKLSVAQEMAVERLARGDTITAAAEAAGVARETLHRWLRDDPVLSAALNAARAEIRDAAERTLLTVVQEAANNLLRAVEEGDVHASLAVLKGMGFLSGAKPYVGSQDPADIVEARKMAEAQRENDRMMSRLLANI